MIMNINENKVFLTYSLGKKHLVSRGIYKPAKISKTKKMITYDCGIKDNEVVIDVPMKTVKAPIYSEATATVTLGKHFLERALERPKGPKYGFQRWLRSEEGKLYQNWNKLSEDKRVEIAVGIYVADMTGSKDTPFSFEII
jgi:hypothetical protein